MIQSYLKTGMVFYDSIDKQHFRSDCCKETFCQFTDDTHFPSFQFFTDSVLAIPLVVAWRLFDLEDNDLGNVPGFPILDTYHHVNGYNISHDYRDIVAYPVAVDNETCYYLRLTINTECGVEYWYSEAFKVCDCEVGITECNNEELSFYDTQERGDDLVVLTFIGHGGGQLWYYKNKTYGCWMQRGGVGYSSESMVYAINNMDCKESDSYGVGIGIAGAIDSHAFPAIIVADDGHIVIAHEKLKNAGGNAHNSMMYVKRSDNPEDETSWVNAIAHNAGYFDEVGNDADPRLSYPSLDKLSDGKLFLICRESTATDLDHISVHRSDDNGVSWNAMGGPMDGGWEIVDFQLPPSGDVLAYKGLCTHYDDGIIHMFFKYWDADNDIQPNLYFLQTSDNGVTWESVDGVLSQDITVAGAITAAQLNAGNGRVLNLPAVGSRIYHMSGIITNDGIPYLAIIRKTDSISDYLLYIYYWNGAAWVGVNTTIPISTTTLSAVVIIERCNKIEIIALTEETAVWKWRIYQALKTDLTTWTIMQEIGDIYDGVTSLWAAYSFNFNETDCETLAYVEPTNVAWYDFNILTKCAETSIFCDMITLNWWSDCDWDDIIYQYGFRNSLVLDIALDSPKEDIVQNADSERGGEKFFSDVVIKKIYRISERIPEYLWNALIRLPAYGSEMPNFHAWITLPDGSACPMSEVAVLGEWDNDNCMNTFTIEFVDDDEYPVVAGNCCENEDVSEV